MKHYLQVTDRPLSEDAGCVVGTGNENWGYIFARDGLGKTRAFVDLVLTSWPSKRFAQYNLGYQASQSVSIYCALFRNFLNVALITKSHCTPSCVR